MKSCLKLTFLVVAIVTLFSCTDENFDIDQTIDQENIIYDNESSGIGPYDLEIKGV